MPKTNLACTRHLARTQQRLIERQEFSREMFGSNTKVVYDKIKKRFARDVSYRSSAEFTSALQRYGHDVDKLVCWLSFVTDCLVQCYSGNCRLCMSYSLVCKGDSMRSYLPKEHSKVFMSLEDKQKLRTCLALRFSRAAIESTKFNSNTQKCEAVNRAYIKSVPKSVTYSRNYLSLIHI